MSKTRTEISLFIFWVRFWSFLVYPDSDDGTYPKVLKVRSCSDLVFAAIFPKPTEVSDVMTK